MCIPSSLDPTIAPSGCHVLSLFIQYTPYQLKDGKWNDEKRNTYADKGDSTVQRIILMLPETPPAMLNRPVGQGFFISSP